MNRESFGFLFSAPGTPRAAVDPGRCRTELPAEYAGLRLSKRLRGAAMCLETLFLLAVSGAALGAGPSPPRHVDDPAAEIKRLDRLVRNGGGDSLKYELALIRRDSGSIEERRRALRLFDEIRGSYGDSARYHWDVALTYEYGGRIFDARQALERAARLDPGDASIHVRIAELWLRELLRVYDLGILARMEAQLDSALVVDPDDRDALFLLSLVLHLEKSLPGGDPPELTFRGRRCAERILAADSTDGQARLLLAVHSLGLSRMGEAENEFLAFVDAAPPDMRAVFMTSERTVSSGIRERLDKLGAYRHVEYDKAWWAYRDPSPLTSVNEAQLEYWKRLAESEFLFGRPADGVRGWDTEPGEAWVRYGPPNFRAFDPGSVHSDPNAVGPAAYKFTMVFEAPSWVWGYRTRSGFFTLEFEDRSLNNRFIATERTAEKMAVMRRNMPAVFLEAVPGQISTLFASHAGVAGEDGKVRQSLYFGIGPWRDPGAGDWLEDSTLEFTVRDSVYHPVAYTRFRIEPEDVYRPLPGTEFLVLGKEISVVPGRYLVTAEVVDAGRGLNGSISLAIDVPEMPGPGPLRLSDLDLALTAGEGSGGPTQTRMGHTYVPNPAGLVADERNLDVFYEIYNLATRVDRATYRVRYTVLPRAYVVAYDYHVRRGNARPGMLVGLAEQGMVIRGNRLDPENYSDITFPLETSTLLPGQPQIKGARVDVAQLVPGEYVLVVTVTDAITGEKAQAQRLFRVVTNNELRRMFAYHD